MEFLSDSLLPNAFHLTSVFPANKIYFKFLRICIDLSSSVLFEILPFFDSETAAHNLN